MAPDGLTEERHERDRWFAEHYASPIPEEDRERFSGLPYFPPEDAWRLPVEYRALDPERTSVPTTSGHDTTYTRAGTASLRIDGVSYALAAFDDGDGVPFVPFRDATAGTETYGGGRYVDVEVTGDGAFLDFNRARNPFCVYDEEFVCPLPPPENWLPFAVPAGEKMYFPGRVESRE